MFSSPAMERLAAYPFVWVRLECGYCQRKGRFRLARLAARFGPDIPLDELLSALTADCVYRNRPGLRRGNQYVPKCHAHFPDLLGPKPPDLPPGMAALRLVRGGKR